MDAVTDTIIALVIGFLRCDPESISITPYTDGVVNCYNNSDYRVTVEGDRYFVKVANPNGKELGTSMPNEVERAALAHQAGISPRILIYDPKESIMISEFIETKEVFDLNKPMAKQRYVALLRKLHSLNIAFPLEFSPFDIIHHYVDHALKREVELPALLLEEILPQIDTWNRKELCLQRVPCHLDQSLNILDNGERLYLIDWECAAMSDPLCDLASMAAVEEISDEEMLEILGLYLQKTPSEEEWRRFYQMRILADLQLGSYCYLQTKVSLTRKELYQTFAAAYLQRVTERLSVISLKSRDL